MGVLVKIASSLHGNVFFSLILKTIPASLQQIPPISASLPPSIKCGIKKYKT